MTYWYYAIGMGKYGGNFGGNFDTPTYVCRDCGFPARNSSCFIDPKGQNETLDCPECGCSGIIEKEN